MNYEKRCNELIDAIKEMMEANPHDEGLQNWVQDNVPELAESEDERIRKVLIDIFNVGAHNGGQTNGVPDKDILAWLEKLGEQNATETQSEEFDNNIITRDDEILQAISIGLTDVVEGVRWSTFGGLPIEEIQAWIEKQVSIDKEKMLIGARKDVASSIITYLDRNTLGLCLSNMECEDLVNAVVDSDWGKVYGYMKKKLEKQGESKVSEPNWCHHKVDLSDYSEEYRKAYYDGWNNCNMQHSQCNEERNDVVKCLINGMKFYYEDNEDATWGTDKWSMPVKHIIETLENQVNMTQEDKQLLLKDLSTRLPYSPFVQLKKRFSVHFIEIHNLSTYDIELFNSGEISNIKPYLRSMSSMTEEEWQEYQTLKMADWVEGDIDGVFINAGTITDWLNKNMFDYRGLIPKGLAIAVTKENNPYKTVKYE